MSYTSSPSEHHSRAACTSISQRPRIWISPLFATEESTAASPEAVANIEGSSDAGGTAASDGVEAVVSNVGAGVETSTVVEQEEEQLTYEQITRKAKLEEIERLRSKEKFITQKTGTNAKPRIGWFVVQYTYCFMTPFACVGVGSP